MHKINQCSCSGRFYNLDIFTIKPIRWNVTAFPSILSLGTALHFFCINLYMYNLSQSFKNLLQFHGARHEFKLQRKAISMVRSFLYSAFLRAMEMNAVLE